MFWICLGFFSDVDGLSCMWNKENDISYDTVLFYSYYMKVIRLVTNLFWQALSYKEKGNLLLCLVIITQVGAQIITPTLEKDFLCYFILCCSWTNRKNGAFIITTTNNNSKRLHIWRRLYDFWLFPAKHN